MPNKIRRLAEERVKAETVKRTIPLTPEEMQQKLFELEVHQVELEMQNDELHRTQAELQTVRAKYFDLYDLAPIGYITLNDNGLILEANLYIANLLGVNRSSLINQQIIRFIHNEDRDIYYLHRKQIINSNNMLSCELRLASEGPATSWVSLQSSSVHDVGGTVVHRVTISDISERKQTEYIRSTIENTIQHDLRSPAANAVSITKLLLTESNITDKQKGLLISMRNSGQKMLDTLNSSLELFKVESGQYHGKHSSIDCLALVFEISHSLNDVSRHNLANIDVLMNNTTPLSTMNCFCTGNVTMLRASLYNLITKRIGGCSRGKSRCEFRFGEGMPHRDTK